MKSNPHRRVSASSFAILVSTLAVMLAASTSQAHVDGDVRAGIYPNADAVSVGGGVLANMGGPNSGWYFNPNVEVALGDSRDIVAMSGDVHYDLATGRRTAFWMGAGPALLLIDRQNGGSDTDLGMNVLTGVGAKNGQIRPFAQLRGTVANESQVTIAGGIRF